MWNIEWAHEDMSQKRYFLRGVYKNNECKISDCKELAWTGDRGNLVSHKYLPLVCLPAFSLHFHTCSLCPLCPLSLTSKWHQVLIVFLLFLPSSKYWLFYPKKDRITQHSRNFIFMIERFLSVFFPHPFNTTSMWTFWRALSEYFARLKTEKVLRKV